MLRGNPREQAASVTSCLTPGAVRNGQQQRFSYRVASVQADKTKKRVLVVAAEDYTGTSPNRKPGYATAPRYLQQHVDALKAAGYEVDTFNADAPPLNASGEPGAIK